MAKLSKGEKIFSDAARMSKKGGNGGSFKSAEAKFKLAIELEPSLKGKAYLALAHGADGRLFDASEIKKYRDVAVAFFQKQLKQDPKNQDVIFSLALAYQVPQTIASYKKSLVFLKRLLEMDQKQEYYAEQAKMLEKIHWKTFGGWSMGYPWSSVRRAKEKNKLSLMQREWKAIAASYEKAGSQFKSDYSKWKRWLKAFPRTTIGSR